MRPLILLLLAVPVAAQQAPPSDSLLAAITARGKQLNAYDIAAWHAGDAITALQPSATDLNASFARIAADGKWEVDYGRLTPAHDTFFIVYRAVQVVDSTYTATKLETPVVDVGTGRDMAAAFLLAQVDFGGVSRPYNAYVIPSPAGGYWVYLLPAQTDPRVFPLGGDVRYRIVRDSIVEKVRFHNAVFDRSTAGAPGGQRIVALMHASFDSLPNETDVFVVLRRYPKVPEVVATKYYDYQVAVDGTITWTPAKPPGGP